MPLASMSHSRERRCRAIRFLLKRTPSVGIDGESLLQHTPIRIPVRGVESERRSADRDVLRAVGLGGTVADPLPPRSTYCLAGQYVKRAVFVLHPQSALQNNCIFFEIRRLAGLDPASGATH